MNTQTLSRRVRAPEDIRIGEHVAVTQTTYQLLPDTIDSACGRDIEPLTVTMIPHTAGRPLRVVGVSLPFVMTASPTGERIALDMRRHRLMRVNDHYAKAAKAKDKKACSKKRKRKGKRKDKKSR